jgi:hypothetical protein
MTPLKEASKDDAADEKKGPKCLYCKKHGHIRRECDEFKAWLPRKGNDFISFIVEFLFTDFSSNTWWIDSGATVHVTNSSKSLCSNHRKGDKPSSG